MKTTIDGIEHFVKLMRVPTTGIKVNKDEFTDHINSYFRVYRENYCGGSLWKTKWLGKTIVIASTEEYKNGIKYYIVKNNT